MATRHSNLDLIRYVDRFPYVDEAEEPQLLRKWSLYQVMWEDDEGEVLLGYMPEPVVQALLKTPVSAKGEVDVDMSRRTVTLFRQLGTEEERTKQAVALGQYWRANDSFKILRGWRDELWPVYGRRGELLYNMERVALSLFGAMRYGVHLTAYVRSASSPHGIRIWVGERAATKSTYPGMLDNAAAGGLMSQEDPFECIIREADEEASIPGDVMRANAKGVGTVTYIYITDERTGEAGYIYPECQWVYDVELPEHVLLTPKDGEAAGFRLCTVDEIKGLLAQGRFKPNCALVMIDFFIRHGILHSDNEPDLDEIKRHMHRRMPFPGPRSAAAAAAASTTNNTNPSSHTR